MKNLKRILALILVAVIAALALVSCSEESNDVEYKQNGIQFTLPKSMRQNVGATGYDYYFDNLDSSVIFTATKADAELLLENGIDENITLEEYMKICVGDMDVSKIYLEYDEARRAYSYRYNYTFEGNTSETFFYVVIIGDVGNLWYVEMMCDYETSAETLPAFEVWAASIKTYAQQ